MFSTGAFLKAYIPWWIHRCVNLQSTGYRFLSSLSDGIPDHRVSAKLGNNTVTGIRLCSLFLLKNRVHQSEPWQAQPFSLQCTQCPLNICSFLLFYNLKKILTLGSHHEPRSSLFGANIGQVSQSSCLCVIQLHSGLISSFILIITRVYVCV